MEGGDAKRVFNRKLSKTFIKGEKIMKNLFRNICFLMLAIFTSLLFVSQISFAGDTAQNPLFIGVHHVGLYTGDKVDAMGLVKWYEEKFDFEFEERKPAYFANRPGSGGLEIMKKEPEVKGHIAIEVSDMEAARKALESRGVSLNPTKDVGPRQISYIKGTDPAGYKIHLFYVK